MGESIPALTAASPITSPPRIETDVPTFDGILASLSLSISKHIIITRASINPGKGTLSLWEAKLVSKFIGTDSGLWVVILM